MAKLGMSPTGASEEGSAKLEILKNTIYEEMQQHGSEQRLYSQKDLTDLNVIPNDDLSLLLQVINELTADQLLVPTNDGRSGIAWRWRNRDDAKK
jgi:DNA-directed RNA polymerase III subunit RPC6